VRLKIYRENNRRYFANEIFHHSVAAVQSRLRFLMFSTFKVNQEQTEIMKSIGRKRKLLLLTNRTSRYGILSVILINLSQINDAEIGCATESVRNRWSTRVDLSRFQDCPCYDCQKPKPLRFASVSAINSRLSRNNERTQLMVEASVR